MKKCFVIYIKPKEFYYMYAICSSRDEAYRVGMYTLNGINFTIKEYIMNKPIGKLSDIL